MFLGTRAYYGVTDLARGSAFPKGLRVADPGLRHFMKLDRLLARHQGMGRNRARQLIAARQVRVDEQVVTRNDHEINRFTRVDLLPSGEVVAIPERRLHFMLHKPAGVVSATTDPDHPTVVDLIDDPDRHTLHLAGRLDRFSTGLILLTNDGRWSKRLMDPDLQVAKVYLVETATPIPPEAVAAFAAGFYFPTEDLTTRPAKLEILAPCHARVTLHEGRYHQIKRMFHRVDARVAALHRESIGPWHLPADLQPGEFRHLSREEIDRIDQPNASPTG